MNRNEAIEKLRAASPAVTWKAAATEGRIIGEYTSAGFVLVCVDHVSENAWRADVVEHGGSANTHRDPVAAMRGAFTKARKRIVRDIVALDAARRGAS